MQTLKKFIKYYKPYKTVFFIDLLCATIISAIDLAFPQLLRTLTKTLFAGAPGKIISALTNDMRPVEDYYLDCILAVIDMGVGFVGALALMLAHDGSEDGARHEKGAFRPI